MNRTGWFLKVSAICVKCEELPCKIWRETKDLQLTDEEFQTDIQNRIRNLLKN